MSEETAQQKADRLEAALLLVWSIHVRKHVHLGLERWSGFEQECIPCICALALGKAMDPSPTEDQFVGMREKIKSRDDSHEQQP